MAFNIPNQTTVALQRPTNPPTTWTRPASWPTITDDPDKVQFLYADTWPTCSITTNFLRTTASANLYIDWGDGSAPTTASSADYPYSYSHNYTPGTGVTSSLGYSTFIISVFTDESASVILAKPQTRAYTNPTGFLEAYYGDNTMLEAGTDNNSLSAAFKGATNSTWNLMLEYVKLPNNYMSQSISNNNLVSTFENCYNLKKVDMPSTMSSTVNSLNSMFLNCRSLQSIVLSELPGVTDMGLAFNSCYALNSITLPNSLPEVTTLSATFGGCYNLSTLRVPLLPKCISYNGAFQNCGLLLDINIPSWTSTAQTIDITNMFNSCYSLANIVLPNTAAAGTLFTGNNMFGTCRSLVSVVLPSYWDTDSLLNYFQNDANLQSVVLPTSMPSLTSLNTTFQGCVCLQNITLPTTVGASMDMTATFNGCFNLSKVDIPQSYNITTLNTTFNQCAALNSVTLPTGSQDNLTSFAQAFSSCFNLQNVTLPSSMTSLTSLNSTFSGCSNLQSVVFPSSLNAVTLMTNCFLNCFNLQSVTLPVSMSTCATFATAFSNCYLLGVSGSSVITMPSVVPTNASYNNTFANCRSMQNVVLPTTQTTTGPTSIITSTFTDCWNLKSITNTDKLGSTATNGTLLNGTGFTVPNNFSNTSSLSFSCRLSKLELQGTANLPSKISGLRLTNTGTAQWTGTSPQINVSYTNMSTAALNTLFADMAAQGNVTSKTINITSATGAAGLSAGDRLVITSKGWTITG